ncbi:hypothetical protein [Tessaracoccus oleiagri]|uniref:Restriction endonuclease n=1 Tax=Tessaracoccus oleiagri TaxID=686624 RepID=A0A1G9K1J0_9ACTN|nr:hypothetical protein [Tessaracoccus oleiagri]SDL43639.1 hypothetical protein SAMN04488242_1591 [Tessaracoccus oleiagri]
MTHESKASTAQATTPQADAAKPFLYEDDVVTAVMTHLAGDGWSIEGHAMAHQHGDDIVARRGVDRLVIEAKGAGSSKMGTKRYGSLFTRNQVRSHVSVAIHRALRVWSGGEAQAGLAFPDNQHHREMVSHVLPALRRLGIAVFWVADDLSVSVDHETAQ